MKRTMTILALMVSITCCGELIWPEGATDDCVSQSGYLKSLDGRIIVDKLQDGRYRVDMNPDRSGYVTDSEDKARVAIEVYDKALVKRMEEKNIEHQRRKIAAQNVVREATKEGRPENVKEGESIKAYRNGEIGPTTP